MSNLKTHRLIVALAGAALLFIARSAHPHTAPETVDLACEGMGCAVLTNSGIATPPMTGVSPEDTKDPKHLLLDGDAKLACECLLCLFAGTQAPKECQVALAKYYLIQAASPFQTMIKRRNFLQLCPKK